MKKATLYALAFVLGMVVTVVGCGLAGAAEGQVGGKTSGSANIANPVK